MATKTMAMTSIFLAPAASLFLAGYGWASTQLFMPQLYEGRPQQTTPMFASIFYGGAFVALPCSLGSAAMSGYVAYLCQAPGQRKLYLASLVANLITTPITMLIMLPGINRLISISRSQVEQEKCEQTLEHRQLLKNWAFWNGVRTMLYLCGGGASLWAGIFG